MLVNFHRSMKMTVQCYAGINAYFFVPPYLKFVFCGYLFTVAFILILCIISAQRRFPTGVDSRPGKILKTSCSVNKEKNYSTNSWGNLNLSFADPNWQIIGFYIDKPSFVHRLI